MIRGSDVHLKAEVNEWRVGVGSLSLRERVMMVLTKLKGGKENNCISRKPQFPLPDFERITNEIDVHHGIVVCF